MVLVDAKIAAETDILGRDLLFLKLIWSFEHSLWFVFPLPLDPDEIDSEDSTEPPHKRLCLSSEDDQSIDDSTPCISVVALPRKSVKEHGYLWNRTVACKSQIGISRDLSSTVTYLVKKIRF